MQRHAVDLHIALALPGALARDAAMHILAAIDKHEAPYDHLTLSLGLRDLKIPVDADLSVPVETSVELRPQRWEGTIEIQATNNQKLFPRFSGTISVTPNGPSASELWLQGSYETPVGVLGEGFDETLFRGAAETSLLRFLQWLGGEVTAKVVAAEREYQRETRGQRPS